MLGTKGESSAACQMLKCERKRGPRGQGGKEDWRGLGDPKLSQTKAPPTLPAPTPSQRNHVLQPGGGGGGGGRNGRGPGKTTKIISSRNVHLQLEGAQGQAPPQQASRRAAGALRKPCGHSGVQQAPWGPLTCPSCQVLSPPGRSRVTSSVTKQEELSPGTRPPVLVII